ncbi:SRPBCC family protein [Rhodococcus opacus]|uniref:SRPBCC family protein n=1 Tax=Rhodococcus opacus TaxID=37919 RepID=A0AAX3YT59_RHOOP|nr:SRPBCC family protein [Rhodococcus opacus]MCZ4586067.1 SRPBCC family protein [Rhodococcus opacus]MDV6245401.1 SRPBCC family protein [Rhodococcus opacus]WLF52662.1 SRPBCC family protein [Rhodococcus opacus]
MAFTGASGPGRFEVTYRTEETAEGTRVSCHMRMEQKGLFALGDRVVAASLRRDFAANLRNLKALLETRAE